MLSIRNYCHILMRLEFSRQIFEKYSNTTFHKKKFVHWEARFSMRSDRRTDRYEANSLFAQFCEKRLKMDRTFLP